MSTQRMTAGLTLVNMLLLLFTLADARWTIASDAPQVLRARALEIVDERGTVRSSIQVQSGGSAVLRLVGDGGAKVQLAVESGASRLQLNNKDGRELVMQVKVD